MDRGLTSILTCRLAMPPVPVIPAAVVAHKKGVVSEVEMARFLRLIDDLDELQYLSTIGRERVILMLLGFMGLNDALLGFSSDTPGRYERVAMGEAISAMRDESCEERAQRLRWYLLQIEKGFLAIVPSIGGTDMGGGGIEWAMGLELVVRQLDATWFPLARWTNQQEGGGAGWMDLVIADDLVGLATNIAA